MQTYYKNILGHGQVHPHESGARQRLAATIYKFRVITLFLLLFQWYLELGDKTNIIVSQMFNIVVWLLFMLEFNVTFWMVKYKLFYIKNNWPLPFIILSGIPIMYMPELSDDLYTEAARLLLVAWLITPWIEICIDSLSDNYLGTTLFAGFFIILFAGIIISGIDPAIENPWEGIWWACVTMTTVGYGDIVPESFLGRLFAVLLILLGLSLFAALTGNFSAIFVKRRIEHSVGKKNIVNNSDIIYLLEDLDNKLKNIEHKVDYIVQKNNIN